MNAPGRLNLTILQGATFRHDLTWKTGNPPDVVNLSGYLARMQMRAKVSDAVVLIELTTANGGIVLDPLNGGIAIYISAADTASLAFKKAFYDLEMIAPNGDVIRLVEGIVIVSPEVTR